VRHVELVSVFVMLELELELELELGAAVVQCSPCPPPWRRGATQPEPMVCMQ
jgi:hypothetical protein